MAKTKKADNATTWRGSDDLRPMLVPIGDLSPDPANVRRHGERNRETIRASLRRYGQMKPVVADKQGVVRAGNGTLAEAKELGWTHIAVTRADLSSVDLVGYAVADNRTAELAEWDSEALTETLKALESDGFDLDAAGFNSAELDELLGSLASPSMAEGVPVDDPAGEWQGMPEFQQKDEMPLKTINVHFESFDDMRAFAELVGQTITEKTKYIWHPKQPQRMDANAPGYVEQ